MKIFHEINHIHDTRVINIAEFNLLHNILNPSKCTKNINSHYSPILHGCVNTRRGYSDIKEFSNIIG